MFLLALLALAPYDPMALAAEKPKVESLTWKDSVRKRDVPVRIYAPAAKGPHPVVIFSHGLGGSRMNNVFLADHLSRRGYLVVMLQHPGSDESVWKGLRPREVMPAMKAAASGQNLELRAEDVRFAIDQIQKRPDAKGQKIGMSGHSFGAVTTQATSGMSVPIIRDQWRDERIAAAIMYSPSLTPGQSVAGVKIPWLLVTGTEDGSPIGNMTPAERLKVFPALPKGDKFELVLDGAEHGAFSDSAYYRGGKRNPNHHPAVLAVSTAFWDAYLRRDSAAKAWLSGKDVRKVLEPKDRWQTK